MKHESGLTSSEVSWIRFIAMIGVVAVHSVFVPEGSHQQTGVFVWDLLPPEQFTGLLLYENFFKFCTIVFFLISGYLFGKKATGFKEGFRFFLRRVTNIGKPWLMAFSLFLICIFAANYLNHRSLSVFSLQKVVDILFSSTYWFVANIFFSLFVLLILQTFLPEKVIGLITGLVSVYYGLNIYLQFGAFQHTYAFGGYMFYIWLGKTLALNPGTLEKARQIPMPWVAGIVAVLFALSCKESFFIQEHFHASQFHNTLKLTNQLYSLAVFVFLAKLNINWGDRILAPRSETFGVYLYHTFFLAAWSHLPLLKQISYGAGDSVAVYLAKGMVRGVIVLALTLLLVKILNRTGLGWVIGNVAKKKSAPDAENRVEQLVK